MSVTLKPVRIVVLVLLLMSGVAFAGEPDINKRYSFSKALELSKEHNRPIMIFIWSVYCNECEKLKAEIFSDATLKSKLSENIVVAWIDILSKNNNEILKHYQARATPTVIFTDVASDGDYPQEFIRTHSSRKDVFTDVLDETLALIEVSNK